MNDAFPIAGDGNRRGSAYADPRMRASPRRRLLALLALLFAASLWLGCAPTDQGASPVLEIPRWTLESALGRTEVTLPAHVEGALPKGRTTYTLTTRVALPPELRGRPLTLTIATLPALARLRVGSRDAVDLETSTLARYASSGQHAWRIDAADAHDGALDLAITADRAWLEAAWVNTVPRLSATEAGDPPYVFVARFNEVTAIVALTTVLLMSCAYAALFLLDRRRKAELWLSLQGFLGASYPALVLGITQPVFGTADIALGSAALCAASTCALHFAMALLERPPPSRAWWLWTVAALLVAVVAPDPFRSPNPSAILVVASILAVSTYAMATAIRAKSRTVARFAVIAFPISAILVLGLPDTFVVLGLPDLCGGLRGESLAIALVSLLEAVLLIRSHDESNRRADALNVELAAQVVRLRENNDEIRVLADELRRQILARSERLAEALVRIGPVGGAPRTLAAGDVIDDRYRIVRRVGEGGMGIVYEAVRLPDGKRVALKILHAPRNGAELARLAREAEIASRIAHPNVVSVVDVDIAQSGALFIVMEYVAGASLDALGARYGELPWAWSILEQVAAGLAALHAAGVVHRDLKPGNVLVAQGGPEDVAKIADFGIARRESSDPTTAPRNVTPGETVATADGVSSGDVENEAAPPVPSHDTLRSITHTGEILGTPVYMAPELLRGAKLANGASDVYALGVIAREVLTGNLPEGFEVLLHLRTRDRVQIPSIAEAVPSLPKELATLLDACLARDAAERPTAAELAKALGEARAASAGSTKVRTVA